MDHFLAHQVHEARNSFSIYSNKIEQNYDLPIAYVTKMHGHFTQKDAASLQVRLNDVSHLISNTLTFFKYA